MANKYLFLDPAVSLKERVRDLISRLTIDEKLGFLSTRNNEVERLGIPQFHFGAEGAHGFVDREGNNTTFPQTIGLASTWDRTVLKRIGEVAATEARVFYKAHEKKGGLAIWSPTIDMERDPRWGRTEEGYGEDPFLAGELSSAYIRGAQGDDPQYLRVSCAPKHFFANNNEKNRAGCSCSVPQRAMREYYLAPFKAAIKDAKAVSLMTAYNEVNGIPMMLHPMLNDLLKKEWGIEGNLVTDGGDFLQTVAIHHYFETHAETLAAALKNGADSMTDSSEAVLEAAKEALEKKYITEKEIDEHLERILSVRFRFGQFDPPGRCPYDEIDEKDLMKDEYKQLSLEAVKKSIVLLKNENTEDKKKLLPIRPDSIKGKIAVIGPLADNVHLDWYTGNPVYISTPLEGLQNVYGKEKIITADYRDIVSFTTEDGRPLVLADKEFKTDDPDKKIVKKILAVGEKGESPAQFYKEDWGWGANTFTDVESDLLLEIPYYRKESGGIIDNEQSIVTASAKNSFAWFAYTVFTPVPQESGLVMLRTYDNRRLATPEKAGQVLLHDDPVPASGELFRMKVEKDGIACAVECAAKAEKVIVICGNNPMINGRECTDRPSLNLPPVQEELINKAYEKNSNLALVIISGYPYTCKTIAKKVPAILWMAPGMQETGTGLAEVMCGNYSPAGRLPMTWYEDESQLPSIMEYDIISAGTTYQYFKEVFKQNVLWSFGHGLSYTNFTYSDLYINKTSANEDETVSISFILKNTGTIEAEEVPQLYVTVSGSGNAPWEKHRPLKTLKAFERVSLKPGEEKLIRFELLVKDLAIWDSFSGRFLVESGRCQVSIGPSSSTADLHLTGSFEIQGEVFKPRKVTGTIYAERFDDYENCFLHEKRGSGISAVFNRQDTDYLNYAQTHMRTSTDSSGWIKFASLDLTEGYSRCSAVVQGAPGSRIEIRLDKPDGVLAGVIEVPNTGEICAYELNPQSPRRRPVWAVAETKLEKLTGVHDVYFVLHGKTGIWSLEFLK